MKEKMFYVAVTLGAEAIIVGTYIWAAKKFVKSLEDDSAYEVVSEEEKES